MQRNCPRGRKKKSENADTIESIQLNNRKRSKTPNKKEYGGTEQPTALPKTSFEDVESEQQDDSDELAAIKRGENPYKFKMPSAVDLLARP